MAPLCAGACHGAAPWQESFPNFSSSSIWLVTRGERQESNKTAGVQVADIADVVRQRADALMLSGESAAGAYPEKAIGVLRAVATRIEEWCRCASQFLTLPNSVP